MLVMLAWVVLVTAGFNLALSSQLARQADGVLQTRAEAVATTLDVGVDGEVTIREVGGDGALDVGTWIFQGDRLIEGPSRPTSLTDDARAMVDNGLVMRTVQVGESVRLLAAPVEGEAGEQVATVVTSQSLSPYRQTRELAIAGSIVLGLLLLAGTYLVVRTSTDRALRPMEEMTSQAERWSDEDVTRRFGTGDRTVELDRLATNLDVVLDRISAVLRHERSFADHVAHELRTPLAALIAEVDLLTTDDLPEHARESLDSVARSADRIARMLDTLMDAARSTASGRPGRCDAAEVVGALLDTWQHPPVLRVVPTGPTVVGVDADVLTQLITPVLDNARRFATTEVVVTVVGSDREVTLTVHDDGPGIADSDLGQVFDAGWQSVQVRQEPGHHGAGLGLSLVRRLVQISGGTVRAVAGDGATISISLPRS